MFKLLFFLAFFFGMVLDGVHLKLLLSRGYRMNKFIYGIAFFLFPAMAFCGQSLGIFGGTDYTFRTDVSNSGQKVGFALGVRYGYEFGQGVKGELEVTYREGHKRTQYIDYDSGDIDYKKFGSKHAWSYMANVAYEANQLAVAYITPYAGAGIGSCANTTHTKLSRRISSKSEKMRDSCFAWQGFIGAKYAVAQDYVLNARYSYFVGQAHSKSHSVTCGLERVF